MTNLSTTNGKTTWTIDPVHSTVGFSIRHMMITNLRGSFQRVSGTVHVEEGRPETAVLEVEIPLDSIDTRFPPRDAHLKSPEFFDVAAHPTLAFRSTSARARNGALEVTGELTMHGATREVTLLVTEVTNEQRDHNGQTRIGASATGRLKRSEFGLTYNKVLEAGGVALGDEVTLAIDVSLLKSQEEGTRPPLPPK